MHGQANIRYEIYLLIKYIKSVLWRELNVCPNIQDARCLKVKCIVHGKQARVKNANLRHPSSMC